MGSPSPPVADLPADARNVGGHGLVCPDGNDLQSGVEAGNRPAFGAHRVIARSRGHLHGGRHRVEGAPHAGHVKRGTRVETIQPIITRIRPLGGCRRAGGQDVGVGRGVRLRRDRRMAGLFFAPPPWSTRAVGNGSGTAKNLQLEFSGLLHSCVAIRDHEHETATSVWQRMARVVQTSRVCLGGGSSCWPPLCLSRSSPDAVTPPSPNLMGRPRRMSGRAHGRARVDSPLG